MDFKLFIEKAAGEVLVTVTFQEAAKSCLTRCHAMAREGVVVTLPG